MIKRREILIACLLLIITVSIILLLISQKKLNEKNYIIGKSIEKINQIEIENKWINRSLTKTIVNITRINNCNFKLYLNKSLERNKAENKKQFYFVSSHSDCGICVENELFFLDSLAKVSEAEFTILRHSNSEKDFQFFRRNFVRNLNVIQLAESDYNSFFTNMYKFPFYYHEDSSGNPRFFVPNRELPKLSHDFMKAVFSGGLQGCI